MLIEALKIITTTFVHDKIAFYKKKQKYLNLESKKFFLEDFLQGTFRVLPYERK